MVKSFVMALGLILALSTAVSAQSPEQILDQWAVRYKGDHHAIVWRFSGASLLDWLWCRS